MTAANIILIAGQQYHLFSIGSDGYPDSIDRIVSCCEDLIQPDPDVAPDGVCEFILRTDACYLYLMDFDTKLARCWRNRNYYSGMTLRMPIGQTKQEIDLSTYRPQLPNGWRVIPETDADFGKRPIKQFKEMAFVWDDAWLRLDSLSQHLNGSDERQYVDRIRDGFPLIPLSMPYRKPEYWLDKKVHYLTREGIWIEISASPWQLKRIGYDQIKLTDTDRLFSAWLVSV